MYQFDKNWTGSVARFVVVVDKRTQLKYPSLNFTFCNWYYNYCTGALALVQATQDEGEVPIIENLIIQRGESKSDLTARIDEEMK